MSPSGGVTQWTASEATARRIYAASFADCFSGGSCQNFSSDAAKDPLMVQVVGNNFVKKCGQAGCDSAESSHIVPAGHSTYAMIQVGIALQFSPERGVIVVCRRSCRKGGIHPVHALARELHVKNDTEYATKSSQ
jgi:hypothetical protein